MAQQQYTDLKAIDLNGTINEDVMQQIFDASRIPLPFTSRVGTSSHGNAYFEWPLDRLQTPNTANAVSETSTIGSKDDSNTPAYGRVGNHSQISEKYLQVTVRASESDTIGYARALAYQVMMRSNELRRDVEAIAIGNQASNADDPGTSVGTTAALENWISDEDELGDTIYDSTLGNPSQYRDLSTGGISIAGWSNKTGNEIPAVGYGSVTAGGAMNETALRDVVEGLYSRGFGEDSRYVFMARPSVCRKLSEYSFTSSSRISTLVNEGSDSTGARTAQGAVNVWQTDFGTMDIVANRLMQASGDGSPDVDTAFIFNPNMITLSYLYGYRTEPLFRDGLIERRVVHTDWGLCVKNWTSVGALFGIDPTAAMVQS